jgi:hypothetical protein
MTTWVQNIETNADIGTYGVAPNAHYTSRIPVSNGAAAGSQFGTTPLFLPGGAAPQPIGLPLLDSLPTAGAGGNSSSLGPLLTRQTATQQSLPYGQQFLIEGADSPSTSYPLAHPAFGNPSLSECQFSLVFHTFLVAWASAAGTSSPTNTLADRVYGLLLIQPWSLSASYSIAPGGAVTDVGTPAVTLEPSMATVYSSVAPLPAPEPIMIPPVIQAVLAINAQQ